MRESIDRSTQNLSEKTASARTPLDGVHHTLAGIQASGGAIHVQAPTSNKLTRLKCLEQALSEEIHEEQVAADGRAADLASVPASSLFSRLRERLAIAKDVLHQKLSPTYRAQVTTAAACVRHAKTGPSTGREFGFPILNLCHGDTDQSIQRLQQTNKSLRPDSQVLYLDRVQLLGKGYDVMGIQSLRDVSKKDAAAGPCLCVMGDGKRVIFTNDGQRVTTSQARHRLLEEFQLVLQERTAVGPAPKRELTTQQTTTEPRPVAEKQNVSGLSHLSDIHSGTPEMPAEFLEDVERITKSVAPRLFQNLESRISLGGLSRALDEVYAVYQRMGLDNKLSQASPSLFAMDAYHRALGHILRTQGGLVQMKIQKIYMRKPLLQTDQLDEAVFEPVVFERVGQVRQESEVDISTRRFALKLKPESYGHAAELAARLLRDFPDLVDAIKLFPPSEVNARQDSMVVYLQNDAPSAQSERFSQLVENLSDADICRAVTKDERIPGMQHIGTTGIYYVDNPPLVTLERSVTGAMPPFNQMENVAPAGSHGSFMALVVIASNMLATRENITFKEAVQKVWEFCWSVPSRDVTTPQFRQ